MAKTESGKELKTVRNQLKLLVVVAVAVASIIIVLAAVILSTGEIKGDYRLIAQTATAHLKDTLEYGDAAWRYDSETGQIFCGDREITVDLFLDINKSDSTVFHTIFLDDTRVLTNIKNDKGEYVLGTQADSKIYASVKSGETYTKNGVTIINSKYTVCYMPIYDEAGKFFGMLFTGINQKAVNSSVLKIALSISVGAIIALIAVAVFSSRMLSCISNKVSGRLNEEYDELNNFSSSIRATSGRTDAEVGEITKAMNSLAEEAMNQASSAEEAMASTEEFTASIDIVNSEIEGSYEYINSINDCVTVSEGSISDLNESLDASNGIVENISRDIAEGVESTKKANQIVKTIDDIALQINLLALNASIEASHAGQFGRGFAVVADEIKNLAQSSAESAKETADIISAIVKTMNKTAESNSGLVAANRAQLEKSADVRTKMDMLKMNIAGIETKLENIREKSQALAMVKEDLVQVVSRLSTSSEQNAAIAEEVSASTDNVRHDVDDLSAGIESISKMCDDLKSIVDFFG